ncbi:MAG TPA: phosphatase PAP2 family protein, partial [Candidatus Tumulicola sp.]|nr:phosphatase PAP2 family protein [Candidatus Tumulicola sp.]
AGVVVRGRHAGGYGFPSGHTAVAFAVAAALAPDLPRPVRPFVWLLAVIVGFARVYVGAHFPLDVLGGAALGYAIGSGARLAFRNLAR